MKQERLSVADGYVPTYEEIRENRKIIETCMYYGIRVGYFPNKFEMTKDELIGLDYIVNGKKLPEDLAKRLLETKHERITSDESRINFTMTEEEAFKIAGIKM